MSLKKNLVNKYLSININFNTEDYGYKILTSKKVYNFILTNMKNGYNFINSKNNSSFNLYKQTKIKLESSKLNKWKLNIDWDDIECKKYSDNIKGTPCKIGSREKIFMKIKSNEKIGGLGLYLLYLNLGIISKEEHIKFIKISKKIFGRKEIFNDNRDVDWFHLKSL